MEKAELAALEQYYRSIFGDIRRDIARLVEIESVLGEASEDAPHGPGPEEARVRGMEIMEELGFEAHDCDRMIAYAEAGNRDKFIGIIGHLDIVPIGDGWITDPLTVTEKDGYLVGRGVLDDKGPLIMAAYAAKHVLETKDCRYGIRMIMGLDEETGMTDVEHYCRTQKIPLASFTPDASFPVCYGEKGRVSMRLHSEPVVGGAVLDFGYGAAENAVPDKAFAVIAEKHRDAVENAVRNQWISIEDDPKGVKVLAKGIPAHAAMPENGHSAGRELAMFLLSLGILDPAETGAMQYIVKLTDSYHGEQFRIDSSDEIFGPLSIVSGMAGMEDGRIWVDFDSRIPGSISPDDVIRNICDKAQRYGMRDPRVFDRTQSFHIDPEGPLVKLLSEAYSEVTGEDGKPFAMAGGTYSKHLPNCVSFGPEKPKPDYAEWVGGCHERNEGMLIDDMIKACMIYDMAISRLMEAELE